METSQLHRGGLEQGADLRGFQGSMETSNLHRGGLEPLDFETPGEKGKFLILLRSVSDPTKKNS